MYNQLFFLASTAVIQTAAIRILGIVMFGDDLDDYGCKSSAGYRWCNETSNCLHVSEICCEESLYTDDYLNATLSLEQ